MGESVLFPLDLPELSLELEGGALRRTVHPSGVRVLSELMPGARSATIGFWVGVGSRDEHADHHAVGSMGSTHFLEHLLFKGTPTRDAFEIATTFDRIGAEHNALTAKEYTCYYAKVRDVDLEHATEVLSDMVTTSTLDPREFETERGVILEELAMASDDLADVASERLFSEVLEGHPLGRPIGGTPEAIREARRDDVDSHYRDRYHPSTLVVAAAGAVDHDRLVEWVLQGLGRSPEPRWDTNESHMPRRRTQVKVRESAPDRPQQSPAMHLVSRPSEQVNLMLGMPGIVASDERRYAFGLANAVLGSGMSSRLFQEIREKRGLAYTAYSFGASYSDAGLFGIYAGTAPPQAAEVAQLSFAELDRLAAEGITEEERERALGQISGSSALALEDSDTRMSRLARAELGTGEFTDLDVSLSRFTAVTAADIHDVFGEISAGPRTVVAVGDTERSTLDASFAPLD